MLRSFAGAFLVIVMSASVSALAADSMLSNGVSLNDGFQLMYNLEFERAHQAFLSWQQRYPNDPMGQVADAAGVLFSEFNRMGILEAQFYEDDKIFKSEKKPSSDPQARTRFNDTLNKGETLAKARLSSNAKDRDALFAMTLISGLRADYAALIDKSNLTSLHYTRTADQWARQLLAVDPNCSDAHVATGFSKYIIGSMAAPMRWILRVGGVSGDKKQGISELQITATTGQYLAPFARILLAIAYVREKDTMKARELLASLRDQYPKNPLFAREIARLQAQ
ncbi:MAG: hypothetical protein DMG90_19105 [Acidobacteria bacterium]|nr:MAG: hypothetical protein DMG90_19105 [Acidobacteriota bacterium]